MVFEWSVHSRTSQRDDSWYRLVSVAFAGILIFGVITGIPALSAFFMLVVGVLIVVENNGKSQALDFRVDEVGVSIDKQFLPYANLSHFGVAYRDSQAVFVRLWTVSGSNNTPQVYDLQLPQNTNTRPLHEYLQTQLAEVPVQTDMTDVINNWLRL
jgi:hypothetical protein